MNKNTLVYFTKILLLFSLPLILLIGSYFVFDPFYVLRNYKNPDRSFLKTYVRNRISSQQFLNYYPQYKFKSFIFGSSKSGAFLTQDYGKKINDPHPFHFDAFTEDVGGTLKKMYLIENQGAKLENVLWIIDRYTFSDYFLKTNSIIRKKDYTWQDENYWDYQLYFFKSFFQKQYFLAFFDAKINKKLKPYMDDLFKFDYYYPAPYNNFIFQGLEDSLKTDSVNFYKAPHFIRTNVGEVYPEGIKGNHLKEVKSIKQVFDRNNTKYKIVIAPNFDFSLLHSNDIKTLKEIFGAKNIYDYSGENVYSLPISNFYEHFHFKPYIGRKILDELFDQKLENAN